MVSPTSPHLPTFTFHTGDVATTPGSPNESKKSSASPESIDSSDNRSKPSGSPSNVQPTVHRLALSPLLGGGKRRRAASDTSQVGDEVDRHQSKITKGDKSPSPEARSLNKKPFSYATILRMPKGTDDIELLPEEIEDFETELSEYCSTHGATREIQAGEKELPWNRLRFLTMPSVGNWATSDAFPCALSPRELAEQLGCHVSDLRRIFFMENEHTDTTELLLLKPQDIGTDSNSSKTLEAVVKKIYTDAVIEGTEFQEHLGMVKKELYHYHMQENVWQSENTPAP